MVLIHLDNQQYIDFITISTEGNATDFGDLTVAKQEDWHVQHQVQVRGLFGGGQT